MERYVTIKQESLCENVISRSRFISRCIPAADEQAALLALARVRAADPEASHVCYAYRVGGRGQTARFSDAGEPSGTAGMPIFEVLRTNGVTNLLCAVTRYFGGVLLGTGGLARAYAGGAVEALRLAGRVERIPARLFSLTLDYARFSSMESYLKKNCRIDAIDYAEAVRIVAAVEFDSAAAFEAQVAERSDGRALLAHAGESFLEREF